MKHYILKSSKYSDDGIDKNNLDEVRRYIIRFYPATVKEVVVLSKNHKQYGNVLFNQKGQAFWYNVKSLHVIKSNGKLGIEIPIPKRK